MSDSRHNNELPFDAVVAVGSQGALRAFQVVLGCLPAEFPAAVVFDLHRSVDHGIAERLLARQGVLAVQPARDGLGLARGIVFLAPRDHQLLLTGDRLVVQGGDGLPWHRCADALLSSAADALGPRMIAVVLSGRLDGGARGIRDVKRNGGRVLAQDPLTASAAAMPRAALATGCVDFALPPHSLGQALVALCASNGAAELFRVRLNAGARG